MRRGQRSDPKAFLWRQEWLTHQIGMSAFVGNTPRGRRLTPPSSGQSTAGFAVCRLPLMSNVSRPGKCFMPTVAANNDQKWCAYPFRVVLRRAVRPSAARSPTAVRDASGLKQRCELPQTREAQAK